jgi:glycerophosphoryl diester phosphodiesterase
MADGHGSAIRASGHSVNGSRRRSRRIFAGLAIGFLATMTFYYALGAVIGKPLADRVLLIAHRGGSAEYPENTLQAFDQAIAAGAGWLEFDVQMSRDGELVVIHDTTVDRTTNGTGSVADLTLAQLRSLDAGNGQVIPTFAEVLDVALRGGVDVMPELKSPGLYPGISQKLVDVASKMGFSDRMIIQSFSAEALDQLHRIDPALSLCVLYGPRTLTIGPDQPGDAEYVCPAARSVVLNPWIIQQAHKANRQVLVWFDTAQSPLIVRALLAFGVDGLIVDNPADSRGLLKG